MRGREREGDRDTGRQIRRERQIERGERESNDSDTERERDPFSSVSMQSGRVKKQTDQRKQRCVEEKKKN